MNHGMVTPVSSNTMLRGWFEPGSFLHLPKNCHLGVPECALLGTRYAPAAYLRHSTPESVDLHPGHFQEVGPNEPFLICWVLRILIFKIPAAAYCG